MLRVSVRPEKQKELEEKMLRLGIREEDLVEGNIRSSGRGGQKRNKTSNGISLTHGPTGIRIKCCESRSQALNRFFARRRLVEKIERERSGTASPAGLREQKVRKQKERRERRAKKKRADSPSGPPA